MSHEPEHRTSGSSPPLAAASLRLRKPPGRPRTRPDGDSRVTAPRRAALDAGSSQPRGSSNPGAGAPRLLSADQAAAYLGVNPRTIRRLVDAGKLRRVRLPLESLSLRRFLVDRVDLDRLIEQGKWAA